MRKYRFVLSLLISITHILFAKDGDYAVSKISPLLLVNANAVVRLEELRFEYNNTTNAVFTNHYVITILNENADYFAEMSEYYNKLRDISSIEGILYDALGNEMKRLKNKDINDLSGVGNNDLMDDYRKKEHNFFCKSYPYTIEYSIVTRYRSTMFFPGWYPQGSSRLAVEQSKMTYVFPKDYTIRYKMFNYSGNPAATSEGNKNILTWSIANLTAIKREIFSPKWNQLTTSVIFAPTKFEIQGYEGNMNSWKEYGDFSFKLKQGRDQLPDNVKQKVHALTDTEPDSYKKIQLLYEYMQKNTRYISIQLGIGGWQPFEASFVAQKGYGDCKALTNYMYSLLKEAGITSKYALIKAGSNESDINIDFPSSQFNHVILCVPDKKDSIWIECTSQTLTAGYLGDFTDNRHALIVDSAASKIVLTPKYTAAQNVQARIIKAQLITDANLNLSSITNYAYLKEDDLHGMVNNLSKEKIKEYLDKKLNFPTYEVNSFKYEEEKSRAPIMKETLQLLVSNYATITGKRLFVTPNMMSRIPQYFAKEEVRKNDIVINDEFTETDSVELEIPAGYELETTIKELNENGKYGTYNCAIKMLGNKIIYTRKFIQNSGHFPVTEYKDIAAFYDKIYKADRSRIVLVKNEN